MYVTSFGTYTLWEPDFFKYRSSSKKYMSLTIKLCINTDTLKFLYQVKIKKVMEICILLSSLELFMQIFMATS